MPHPELFRAYPVHVPPRTETFIKVLESAPSDRQTDRQRLWLYLAAFRCKATKQSYKIISQEEWTVIILIKVKRFGEAFKKLGSIFGHQYRQNGMKIRLCMALKSLSFINERDSNIK